MVGVHLPTISAMIDMQITTEVTTHHVVVLDQEALGMFVETQV